MICCSIQNKTREQILSILEKVEMAEIRLDLCTLDEDDIGEIFMSDTPLVASCRAENGDWNGAGNSLLAAIRAGANYADLPVEAPVSVARRISRACAECGTVLIRSYHDFEGTKDLDALRQAADRCRNMGGEIIKTVTFARNDADAARVLSLYKYYSPESLIAFSMGEKGQASRLECLARGAPFTYSSFEEGEQTAPGQIPYSTMQDMLRSRAKGSCPVFNPTRAIRMPASKSYAQRAVLAAALAEGKSVLKAYSACEDSEAATSAATALGAKVERFSEEDGYQTLEITGGGFSPAGGSSAAGRTDGGGSGPLTIDAGESGLLARLSIPLTAQLCGQGGAVIDGRGTLLGRPMEGADASMRAFGATIHRMNRAAGAGELFLPVKVTGPLRGGRAVIDGSKSSQLISGALMALPLAARCSTLVINNPTSIPYLYMTMDILRHFGIRTRSRMTGGREILSDNWQDCDCIEVKIKENQRYRACELSIEADWSAAAVFMAAGAIFGKVRLEGLDTSSLQADIQMLDILMDAGASISQTEEPTGTITVQKAPLRPIQTDLSNCPDLFPVTAVFCAFCQGTSVLGGVHRLLHKESDRAAAITDTLKKLGVGVSVKGDTIHIKGESPASRLLGGRLLHGGAFSSGHDHRMVMALSLAAIGADSPVVIDDTACVGKSFPRFNQIWNSINKTSS